MKAKFRLFLLLFGLLFTGLSGQAPLRYSGKLSFRILPQTFKTKNGIISVSGTSLLEPHYLEYDLWTLFQEPVILSRVGICRSDIQVDYSASGHPKLIMSDADKQKYLHIIDFKAILMADLAYDADDLYITFNPGYIGKIHDNDYNALMKMDSKDRVPLLSFNVPQSPDWNKLFHDENRLRYFNAAESIRRYPSLEDPFVLTKIELEWGVGALTEWAMKYEQECVSKLEKERQQLLNTLRKQSDDQIQTANDPQNPDFWDCVDNPVDTSTHSEIDRLSEEIKGIKQSLATIKSLQDKALTQRSMEEDATLKLLRELEAKAQIEDIVKTKQHRKAKQKDKKYGFVDLSDNWVIDPVYDDVLEFVEGMAAVKKDGKWGFVDIHGTLVIPALYDYVESFKDGRAYVEIWDEVIDFNPSLSIGEDHYSEKLILLRSRLINTKNSFLTEPAKYYDFNKKEYSRVANIKLLSRQEPHFSSSEERERYLREEARKAEERRREQEEKERKAQERKRISQETYNAQLSRANGMGYTQPYERKRIIK